MVDPNATPPRGRRGRAPESPAVRFWRKVDRRGPNDCWPWLGGHQRGGYGEMGVGSQVDGTRTVVSAHRLSWVIHHGQIPDDLWVLHKCDNPPCVNPAHLFLGTDTDNKADMWAKGRYRQGNNPTRGEARSDSKLTNAQVIEIRSRYAAGGISMVALGRAHGVCAQTVCNIVHRKDWAHV